MGWSERLGMDKRKRNRRPSPAAPQPSKTDAFAPFSGPHVCQDDAGYWRDEHKYLLSTREGLRCIYCRELLRMEPY